ncbi:MAG: metallophosphoesterase family protein [Gemmataceae bacterium]
MKIAVLSDTHNQLARTRKALELAREAGADLVLHCGDIEDPPIVQAFAQWTAHFVLGNCDWDCLALEEAIEAVGGTLHRSYGHLELDGKKIAFLHGHHQALMTDLLEASVYDYLFHGHTHVACDRMAGTTRVINPGALHRVQVKTLLILEPSTGWTQTLAVE